MKRPALLFVIILVILLTGLFSSLSYIPFLVERQLAQIIASFSDISRGDASANPKTIILRETGAQSESASNLFWLNSGGLFYVQGNNGETIQGDLSTYSYWRLAYAKSNSLDTDNGYHPQNLLRLITNVSATDTVQTVYIQITKDNISQSPNRNSSNGIFLMSRYHDGDDLYYAGIRVDGNAVIKRKSGGIYHTLAEIALTKFSTSTYDRIKNPSLLPKNEWIGLKVETKNISENIAMISLSVDIDNSGTWKKVLEVEENATAHEHPILTSGAGGIRSDFMDIKFRDYSMEPLPNIVVKN